MREEGTRRLAGAGRGAAASEAVGTRGGGWTRQPRDGATAPRPAPQAAQAPPSPLSPHDSPASSVRCRLSFADSGAISFLSAAFANLGSDDRLRINVHIYIQSQRRAPGFQERRFIVTTEPRRRRRPDTSPQRQMASLVHKRERPGREPPPWLHGRGGTVPGPEGRVHFP